MATFQGHFYPQVSEQGQAASIETVGLQCWDAWIRDRHGFWGERRFSGQAQGALFTGSRGGHREVNVLSGRDLGEELSRKDELCPLE